jgi:hypothetical protein
MGMAEIVRCMNAITNFSKVIIDEISLYWLTLLLGEVKRLVISLKALDKSFKRWF